MSSFDFSDPATIAALTEALTAAGVDGLEISGRDGELRIVVSNDRGAQVKVASEARSMPATAIVKAPTAGCFHASHPFVPDQAEPLPREVSEKDVVGFVRIGSVLLPVPAGRSGLLNRQLAKSGALVGFGDALFEIEPQS